MTDLTKMISVRSARFQVREVGWSILNVLGAGQGIHLEYGCWSGQICGLRMHVSALRTHARLERAYRDLVQG